MSAEHLIADMEYGMNVLRKIRTLVTHPSPFRLMTARFGSKLGFHLVADFFGIQIRLGRSGLSQAIYADGGGKWSADALFLNANLSPGDVYVDVGANIGTLACLAAKRIGEQGICVAFEPHPKTYSELVTNVHLNKLNVIALMLAMGGGGEFVNFTDLREDDQNHVTPAQEGEVISVYMSSLDEILPGILGERRIRLLKIDTEGFEFFVLKGAAKIIRRVDMIYFEISDSMLQSNGISSFELLDFLRTHGFTVKYPNGEILPDYSKLQFAETQNLLAVAGK